MQERYLFIFLTWILMIKIKYYVSPFPVLKCFKISYFSSLFSSIFYELDIMKIPSCTICDDVLCTFVSPCQTLGNHKEKYCIVHYKREDYK